jgi:cell division protein FtsB
MKKNNRFTLLIAAVIMLAVVGSLAFFGFQIVRDLMTLNELKAQKAELQGELNSVNNSNAALQQELDQSDTDSFIERLAREILGWVKPGEIKIVDGDKK